MSTPFTATGTLMLPPDDGQPVASLIASIGGTFDAKVDQELPLTGAATYTIDVSSIMAAGAKAVLVEYDAGSGSDPVMVRVNGGSASGQWELTPGGFMMLGSPAPAAGVTDISLVHTDDAKIRVRLLG